MGKTDKYGDLRRRLVFLLLALVVYRIGTHIPVPGIDPNQLQQLFKGQQGGILSLFNMFSGGALSRFSIFALGIMPYISASIIMQLMSYVVPSMEALKKEGEAGRRKITQYTRYGTLGLALFQSLGIAVALESSAGLVNAPGIGFRVTAMVSLTAGTMFLMWLGEQITERGLGNGISIIIFAGIAAGLPKSIGGMLELVRTGAMGPIVASPGRMNAQRQSMASLSTPAITGPAATPNDPNTPAAAIALPRSRACFTTQALPTGW